MSRFPPQQLVVQYTTKIRSRHECICAGTFSSVRPRLPDADTPVLPVSASNGYPAMNQAPSPIKIKDQAEVLTLNKDLIPDWIIANFNGNPLQWHERYGQFKSAIDSPALSDEIKLTYLKTLVVGKAKDAIPEFAYCGKMRLKTLERKFGQPQAVVTAHLDKLANYPSIKMHSSDQIINFSSNVASFVDV